MNIFKRKSALQKKNIPKKAPSQLNTLASNYNNPKHSLDGKKMKSDRLKKMENELRDLEQWLKLGLVPKKDTEKHKAEIRSIQEKINEEKERLLFLKESGEQEEYVTPKKVQRNSYAESQNLPDIEANSDDAGLTDVEGIDLQTEQVEMETAPLSEDVPLNSDEETLVVDKEEEEEDNPFSDSNRWRRGIADPEAEDW